ncbi:MAG: GGDEF domain-containing protein [Dokdonella sp.]|nr:GGDEF domain-containing protein [Dokdonella sp.]MCB1569893.1 GGDEF domain-containing protein [Xanthomonadales bacterium]MCB1572387.1 GGDEF domain-containing protein [Xanthomonadales bacterium]MCB1576448.1 GGDEF domain-containing protein [Xanthomonadales bacterium]
MALHTTLRQDSFITLRDTIRWRVALVLAILIVVLMITLGTINTILGLTDTARLAWAVLAAASATLIALLMLSRRLGGTIFFTSIAAILLIVPVYGLENDRNMQHWAYIFPPLLVFLLRPGPSLAAMVAYGVYVSWITALLLPPIEVVRFSSGYGLMVCFMYTYALLQEQAAKLLRYHSDHDALSNCLNRRTFNEALDRLASGQGGFRSCEFLLIDIDHFKAINDRHGHLVGDRVITQVAAELGRHLLADAPLFRYGGEEFAVMLVDAEEGAGGALAERLRSVIEQGDFQGVKVTISVGVSRWHAGTGKVESALQKADEALYAAKRAGRNRVEVASA